MDFSPFPWVISQYMPQDTKLYPTVKNHGFPVEIIQKQKLPIYDQSQTQIGFCIFSVDSLGEKITCRFCIRRHADLVSDLRAQFTYDAELDALIMSNKGEDNIAVQNNHHI